MIKKKKVVFWGTETGPEDIGGIQVVEQFARSMSLDEAMDPRNMLCWGMNGAPLPPEHGAPVRLIAPGWYGIANVKWLQRIEIFFFSSRRRHTRWNCDWSSDVCSSD